MIRPGLGEAAAPLALISAIGLGAGTTTAVWLASGVSRLAATGNWTPPAWSPRLLVHPDAPERGWFVAVLSCSLVVLVLAVVLVGVGTRRLLRQAGPRTLLRATELGDLTGAAQEKRARSLRRLPEDRALRNADRGIRLGILGGHEVWMSWEDVALVIMGPRSNKTSAVAVPAILSAPAPPKSRCSPGSFQLAP